MLCPRCVSCACGWLKAIDDMDCHSVFCCDTLKRQRWAFISILDFSKLREASFRQPLIGTADIRYTRDIISEAY